ncbi:telomeric repeat-binding factor 2-like [Liolophura sinensis]|uniref:telomeric repeat-binding factor 2-like n=1 Tax=Liolophura sinensis TaxID=3198878 RepID=UPI0031597AF7
MADEKIQKWILQYVCRSMWNEFRNSLSVSDDQRDLIQGLLQFVKTSHYCPDTNVQRTLLILQCWLADGEDYSAQYSESAHSCNNTVLENFLHRFLCLLEMFGTNRTVYSKFISAVKEQAVLVCCRKKDFSVAKDVYNRIFEGRHTELESVIKSKDSSHPLLTRRPYDMFLKKAVSGLQSIHEKLPTPVLEKVAENLLNVRESAVADVMDHVTENQGDQNGNTLGDMPTRDVKMTPETLHSAAQALGQLNWQACLNRQQLNLKLERIREGIRSDEEQRMQRSFHQTDGSVGMVQPVSTDKENTIQPRTSPSKQNVNRVVLDSREVRSRLNRDFSKFRNTAESTYHYRRNRNRRDRHRLSESRSSITSLSDSSDVGNLPTLGDKPVVRRSLQMSPESNTSRCRSRVKWSEQEVKQLRQGVKRFGKGQWAKIRDAYPFNGRTSVDLKDKWRNIEKQAPASV